MSRAALVVCVVALAGLVGLAAWLALGERADGERRARAELDSAALEAPVPVAGSQESEASLASPPVPESAEPPAASADSAPLAEPPRGARSALPAAPRRAIAGRVVAEVALPDEEIVVTGDAYVGRKAGPSFVPCRARVERDGSFALELPDDASFATLRLEAPSLALEDAVRADAGASDVLLRPRALARVTLRVALPPGAKAPADDPWRGVEGLHGYPVRGNVAGRMDGVAPCVDGAIELARLDPGEGLLLGVENPYGPRWSARVEPLAPLEHREVRVQLERGVTVSGTVVDESGAPIPGARVRATLRGDPWGPSASRALATTDAAGAFAFAGLAPTSIALVLEGSLGSGGTAEVDGRDGDQAGIVLRLGLGTCLRARVAWRGGGEPYSGTATAQGPALARASLRRGRFELCELVPGEYSLDVHAWEGRRHGRVRVESVRIAGEPVELDLVLEDVPLFTLSGTVVDASGAPLDDFSVRCMGENPSASPVATRGDAPGSFVVEDVPSGRVTLSVSARGYPSQYRDVWVGPDPPELRFVLSEPGTVRGRVVDAAGAPAAGAEVSGGERSVQCDGAGRFEVAVDAGAVFLFASGVGSASSETLRLDVAPAGAVEGVVLVLREPCRVSGRVLDAHGRPLAGATVRCSSSAFETPSTSTDSDGAFELAGLPPGEAWLHTLDGAARAVAIATLRPDAAARVELRFEPEDPVHLVGRVTRAGATLACEVDFYSERYIADAAAGADGRFEAALSAPGRVRVVVRSPGADGLEEVRVCEIDVPDAERHEVELELESMEKVW